MPQLESIYLVPGRWDANCQTATQSQCKSVCDWERQSDIDISGYGLPWPFAEVSPKASFEEYRLL